jgi:hypothetical protein
MALYDTMLSLKSPIGTHCLGFAFNLAGFILAAGEKVLLLSIVFLLTICAFSMLKYNAYLCSVLLRVHVLVCLYAEFHFSHLLEQLEARFVNLTVNTGNAYILQY